MKRSKPEHKPDPVPERCVTCDEAAPTILAEWQRPEGVPITVTGSMRGSRPQRKMSEGSWRRRYLCDRCAGATVTSLDPPRRLTRIVPDRLVQVLYDDPRDVAAPRLPI